MPFYQFISSYRVTIAYNIMLIITLQCWLPLEDCMCSNVTQSTLWHRMRFWLYMHPKVCCCSFYESVWYLKTVFKKISKLAFIIFAGFLATEQHWKVVMASIWHWGCNFVPLWHFRTWRNNVECIEASRSIWIFFLQRISKLMVPINIKLTSLM